MKVQDRPYAGNWSEDFINKYRTTRSWTPDAIVTFNGETTLPGCPTCKNKIDFSRFISSVNVGGGIDGSNSCDINLKIPWSYGDSVYKDGRFVLVTGIEVFVYYRGFFQVKELALKSDNIDLDNGETLEATNVETRPYYPVFHGVISGVGVDYSDGAYSVSISTRNMLSFWDNQQINTQQGYFAADPSMSRGSINLKGHVYTNMTPHQIIYDLYIDAGGSAEGTGFALRKTSNVTARTHTGGPQQYSLMMRYLEERFRNGMYGLRMYGASGRMYSALETQIIAFPETTPKGKKQDAEYRKVIKQQNKPYSKQKSKGSVLSRMVRAGLIQYEFDNAEGGRILRTVDGRQLAQMSDEKNEKTGLSMLSLKPFVTDIGNFAQVAFWESSQESKKSIAQRVCDVTGFEFYQDMDGDLVFKPPMYNMDTSSDRVYNIFREDIMSISYSHSEPEATYVTMKGSHFRNFEVGIGGEWGVKGVYVDYSLVAKYGWKSADFDSTYYNSPRQAYYAAAVELDRQNKNTEGCDIQIPLRPEIKPGYPVYVEENDCYYYVESVSHSFSYGGSCTTTLSLVCQRKKFIPPGQRDVKFRDDPSRAVNLGATELPEKYIYRRYDRTNVTVNSQSSDLSGEDMAYKKITGFPNVVMAFDHQNSNPSMLYFDPDFQNIGRNGSKEREMYLNMIVNEAIRLKLLSTDPNNPDATIKNGPWMLLVPTSDGQTRKVPLGVDKGTSVVRVRTTRKGKIKSVTSKRATKTELSNIAKNGNYNIAGINTLDVLSQKSALDGQRAEEKAGAAKSAKASQRVQDKETERRKGLQKGFQQTIGTAGVYEGFEDTTGTATEATILDLMYTVKSALGKAEGSSPLQNLMSALQDRKSSFAPKAQGYFRYYSSSHPSPEHQGPDLTEYKKTQDGTVPTLKFNEGVPDEIQDNVVVASPEGDGDTVMFGNNEDTRSQIVRGLMTRTMYSSGVEYVPTKDILALSFQVTSNFSVKQVPGPTVSVGLVWNGPNTYPGVEYFTQVYKTISKHFNSTIVGKKTAKEILDLRVSIFLRAFNLEAEDFTLDGLKLPTTFKEMPPSKFFLPEATEYFSSGTEYSIKDEAKIKDHNIEQEVPFAGQITKVPLKSRQKIQQHFAQVIIYKAWKSTKDKFPNAFDEQFFASQEPPYDEATQKLIGEVRQYLATIFDGNVKQPGKIQVKRDQITISSKEPTITPIFPISDSKGYEVFGAYQYGRGLRPSRGTLFDALLKQDPTSILTKTQIDELIKRLDAKGKNQPNFQDVLKEAYLERLRAIQYGGNEYDFTDGNLEDLERISIGLGLDGVPRTEEDNSVDLNALANRLMSRSDEQIITNIPSALSEIYPSTEGNEVCECRIHNTDAIILEGSLNLDNFLEIENPLLRSVRNMTEVKAAEWREHQSALRGENIQRITSGTGFASSTGFGEGFDFNSRSGSRLIQPFEDVDGDGTADGSFGFDTAVSNAQAGLQGLSDQQRLAKAQANRTRNYELREEAQKELDRLEEQQELLDNTVFDESLSSLRQVQSIEGDE